MTDHEKPREPGRWVLVEVARAAIAVWPLRSPEGQAALRGSRPFREVIEAGPVERELERLRGEAEATHEPLAHFRDERSRLEYERDELIDLIALLYERQSGLQVGFLIGMEDLLRKHGRLGES
jgi:hypothetical protein